MIPRSYTKHGHNDWVEKYERVECDDGTWKRLDKTKVRMYTLYMYMYMYT